MLDRVHLFGRIARVARARLLGSITHVATTSKAVALTFDDGPRPESTPPIIEVLEKHGAKGTFFVVGEQAKRYPEIVARIMRGGHAVGNHTWDHPSMPLLNARKMRRQLRSCDEALRPYHTRLMRAPYGHLDLVTRLQLMLAGYTVIGWNVAACDWSGEDSEKLAERVLGQIGAGSIVLFHDALYMFTDPRFADRKPTMEAVEIILQRLRNQYEFVTVPELLRRGRPLKIGWFIPPDPILLNRLQRRTVPDGL